MVRWLISFGLALLAPGLTHAQSSLPGTALIVRVPGDERIYIPLRAELGSYRFRVLELPDKPGRRSEALADLAVARDAQAALRARPESMSVELWVKSTATDAGSDSEELVNAGPGRNPDVLALRVTEAMRARGLQLAPPAAATGASPSTSASAKPNQPSAEPSRGSQPSATVATPASVSTPSGSSAPKPGAVSPESPAAAPPSPAANAPKPEVATPPAKPPAPAQPALKPNQPPPKPDTTEPQAPAAEEEEDDEEVEEPAADSGNLPELPPRRPLLFVEAAPLGILNTRKESLGPAIDVLVQLRLQPHPSSSITLVGFIPLWQPSLKREEGRSDVRAWFIGGFADLHVPLQRFELSAGLGAGAMLISIMGTPNPELMNVPGLQISGQSTPMRLGAILGRIGMSLQLTRDLRLQARVMGGILVPELEIKFGQDTVARWGRVLVLGSLGLELALPWER